MFCKNCKTIQRKYELACAAADKLHGELKEVRLVLKHREKALVQGKELVDRLMGVAVENDNLKRQIAELTGSEPLKGVEIKA
jgi:hypothetical protein